MDILIMRNNADRFVRIKPREFGDIVLRKTFEQDTL
jgi:hypothetical protein